MTVILQNYLAQLYAPDLAQNAYERLIQRLEQIQQRFPPPAVNGDLFSERDVTLITYGDTLRQADEAPLRTLHQFARDYLQGYLNTIHLLPFYPYSSDDGFSVIDYYAVNPEVGNWHDVAALSEDFRLMFDAVINHMSAQSEWFKAFLRDEPAFRHLFFTADPAADLSTIVRPRTSPLLTHFEKASGETVHVWTTFSADQVDLNYAHPDTLLRIIDLLLFYVENGAQVIRLDAIGFMWKEIGTSSMHLPQAHTIIQLCRAVLDIVAPQVILITETNVPHKENISYFGDGYNEAQLVYNFTLPPLLFHTLLSGNASRLADWINTLQTPSDSTTFFNFTASHDGIGVRPVEGILDRAEVQAMIAHVEAQGGRVSYRTGLDGTPIPYELNITYVDAVTRHADPVERQVKQFLVSQAIMLALAGVPAVYIHSLLGTRNDLAGMERTGHNRSINRAKLNLPDVIAELDQAGSFRQQVFAGYRHLIEQRIQHAAFHPNARQQAAVHNNGAVLAIERTAATETILALHNITGSPQTVEVPAGRDIVSQTEKAGAITLEPYGVCWLVVG